jgi:hypothetical protein
VETAPFKSITFAARHKTLVEKYPKRALQQKNKTSLISTQTELRQKYPLFSLNCNILLKQ